MFDISGKYENYKINEDLKKYFESDKAVGDKELRLVSFLKHDWDCYLTQFGIIYDIINDKNNNSYIGNNIEDNDNDNDKTGDAVVKKIDNYIGISDFTFNESVLNIIAPMTKRGYDVDIISIRPLDEYGSIDSYMYIEALRFTKNKRLMAIFPLDGNIVPSDRELYTYSGCKNCSKKTETKDDVDNGDEDRTNFYLALIGLLNDDKNSDGKNVTISDDRPLMKATDKKTNELYKKVISKILQSPEGKMLIYSIFLNQSKTLTINNDSIQDYKKYRDGFRFFPKAETHKISSKVEQLKKYIKSISTEFYNPLYNLELACKTDKDREKDISVYFAPEIFINCDFKGDNLNIHATDLFHKLCHYLTMTGKNRIKQNKWYCDYEHNISSNHELIIKYWKDLYGLSDDYKYSKNDIQLLLNDFYKYYDEENGFGSVKEILATSWNNMGTNFYGRGYYGHGLCENLLRIRLNLPVRFDHNKYFHFSDSKYYNSEQYPTYSEFLTEYYNRQKSKYTGVKIKTKPTKSYFDVYSDKDIPPFEIQDNKFVYNTIGCSYYIDLDEILKVTEASNKTELTLTNLFSETNELNLTKNNTVKTLARLNLGLFAARNIVEEHFADLEGRRISELELRALLKTIIENLLDSFSFSDKNIYACSFMAELILRIKKTKKIVSN